MGQLNEEERERAIKKASKLNEKIILLVREKSKIDEAIYKLAKKRDKVYLKLSKNYLDT
jgi:hypothetical protein